MANVLKGITIEIGGDTTELTKALKDVQSKSNLLSSELKEVNRLLKYDPSNVELLAQKQKILAEQITTTKSKLETLKEAQKQVNEQFARGEVSEEQVRAIARAVADTEQKLEGYEKAAEETANEIQELGEESEDAGDNIDDLGDKSEESSEKMEKLKNVVKTIGKVLVGATAAIGAAAVALGKEVIESYGQYEQLVGGVETLFGTGGKNLKEYAKSVGKTVDEAKSEYKKLKEAEKTVLNNASNAFKTAGMSANDYMDNVTSFSASLISSLGGDTVKAAKVADQAIIDMSDNANKMGTDISSIQNAYQGFAKQNYTMLDNLKLGYGGTKEEMQRLLEEAEKISGIKYDISSFADITEAIHVIQTEMGITGTTAVEAEKTIEGSIGMLKASFENFVTGLGDKNADIEALATDLVNSFATVVSNIIPILQNIVKALPPVAEQIIIEVGKILPDLLNTVSNLFEAILNAITNTLPKLTSAAADAVIKISNTIIQTLPQILKSAIEIINTLVKGITESIPKLVPAAIQAVLKVAETLLDNAPKLLKSGLELVLSLTKGIIDSIPQIVKELPKIINAITTFLNDSIEIIVEAGIELLTAIVAAMPTIVNSIVKALPQILTSIENFLSNSFPTLLKAAIELLMAIVKAIPDIVKSLKGALPQIWNALKTFLSSLPSSVWTAIKTGFAGLPENVRTIGQNLIKGLGNGISDMVGWVMDKVRSFGSSILSSLKSFFGIHSPSTVMREQVGKNLVLGIVDGIEKNAKTLYNATRNLCKEIVKSTDSKQIKTSAKELGLAIVQNVAGSVESSISIPQKSLTKTLKKVLKETKKVMDGDYKSAGEEAIVKVTEGVEKQKDSLGRAGKKVLKNFKNAMLEEAKSKEEKNLLKDFFNESIEVLEDSIDKEYAKVIDAASQKIKDFTAKIQAEYDAVKKLQSDMEKNLAQSKLFSENDGEVQLTDFKNQADKIKEYSKDMQQYKTKVSEELMAEIAQLSMEDAQKVLDKFKTMSDEELKAYDESYNAMRAAAKTASEKFYKEQLSEIDKEYRTGITEIFDEMQEDLIEAGENAIEGFVQGMNDKSGDAYVAAKKIASETIKAMKSEMAIHSPSKRFAEIGKFAMLGLAEGIKKNANAPIYAVEDAARTLIDEAQLLNDVNLNRNIQSTYNVEMSQEQLRNGLFEKLDVIVKAIEKGQVLTLNDKTLVGATVDRVDRSLGFRANLAKRGAL